jgi:GntR family transcriptional repressor for pyruvate dehydrogenase complex
MNNDDFLISLKPVAMQRVSEVIYDQIKAIIIKGDLKPGDRLPSERNMEQMMKRSRSTIREALRMLERDGFIRTVPGAIGAIIQEPNTSNVEQSLEIILQTSKVTLGELFEYRQQNDVFIARCAAQRRTPEIIAALRDILANEDRLFESKDFDAFIKTDMSFHRKLAKAANNQVAYIIMQVLGNLIEPKLISSLQQMKEREKIKTCQTILNEHRNIVDAVEKGNMNTAEKAMAVHIEDFMRDLRWYNL